jgi:hypothetical protein
MVRWFSAKGVAAVANENLWKEYEHGARLEQELVRNRWTFFTAMLTVSFVIGGLSLKERLALGPALSSAGFAFGWLIFVAGFYHYCWFHKRAHDIRERLCKLEHDLDIDMYITRTRPFTIGGVQLRYYWAIVALAIAYTIILVVVLFF